MPQMAPLYWTILMMFFSILLMIMFVNLTFQTMENHTKTKKENKSRVMKNLAWKW